MKKLLVKFLSLIVAVTATFGLIMLPKTAVQASDEFKFGAVAGATVKFGKTLEETGLRFTIEVDQKFYAGLGEGVVFGALVTTKSYADNNAGELRVNTENENLADVRFIDNVSKFDKDAETDTSYFYYASVTYMFDEQWQAEVVEQFASTGLKPEEIIAKAKLQALNTDLVCLPYYIIGEQVTYADLSVARSMIKVANASVIGGEKVADDFSIKYLSSVEVSESEVFIEKTTGKVYGLTANEKAFVESEGTVLTADGSASDIDNVFANGALSNADAFFADKTEGKTYYLTAFNGHKALRIEYIYITNAIDTVEELDVTFALTKENYNVRNDGYYILTKDIDANGYEFAKHWYGWDYKTQKNPTTGETEYVLDANGDKIVVWNDTYSTSQTAGFCGTLNGLGHVIDGMYLKRAGLFGYGFAPTIKNVAFTGVTLNSYYGSVLFHSTARQWGEKFDANGQPLLNANGKNDWVLKDTELSDIYVQVDKVIWGNSKRVNILIDNSFSTESKLNNVVIDYQEPTAAEDDPIMSNIYANSHELGTIGGNKTTNMHKVTMFHNCFSISRAPLYNRGSTPYFAENQVEVTKDANGYFIKEIGDVLDGKVNKILSAKGLTANIQYFAAGIRAYDDYAQMAAHAEENADMLATFSDKYWVVVNGVPYWKATYSSKIDLVVTDVNNKEVDLSSNVFDGNNNALTVKLFDETHEIPNLTISGEGIVVEGNKIKLASVPTADGSVELVVETVVDGVIVTKTVILKYTNKIIAKGDVLFSKDDAALDLPSLKAALESADCSITSLEDVEGYIVNGATVDALDLEVIINAGANATRTVDDYVEKQVINVLVGGKTYEIDVYAYTKLIDEAEDLDYFRFDYKATGELVLYDGFYLVTKNIDASNYAMQNHTFNSNAVYPNSTDKKYGLAGVFDGNGYVIDNLSVQSNGIFGWVRNRATIRDIAFTNVTLLAGSYPTLFSHGLESSQSNPVSISNIYVQVKSMAAESGVLINNGPSIHGTEYKNIVIDYTAFSSKELGWLNGVGGRFGTVIDLTVHGGTGNYSSMFENVYTLTSSPVVAMRTSTGNMEDGTAVVTLDTLTVAGNRVTKQGDGTYVLKDAELTNLLNKFIYTDRKTVVKQVNGKNVTYTTGYSDFVLTNKNVQDDIKSYVDANEMIADYSANEASYKMFSDSWIVKGGMVYWKEIYKQNFSLQVKQGDNIVDGDITLTNTKTQLTLDIVDMGGNAVEGATITAPEGIVVSGNVIKLANNPTSEGSYEVKISAVVDGVTIEKYVTVNFTNVVDVKGKVLYSQYDKSLDLPSLNNALAEYDEDAITIEDIEGYKVGDATEFTQDDLYLEVFVTAPEFKYDRTVEQAQSVAIKVGDKVYNLNVYAYTRLIDELSDMDWISRAQVPVASFTGDPRDLEYTSNGTNVYTVYEGYYLMTKNLNGAGLGADGADYMLAGIAGYADSKGNALTGVFDGNGYTISNCIVQSRGIFNNVTSGLVKDVAFKNMTLIGYYSCLIAHQLTYTGKNTLQNAGAITNVYIEGTKIPYTNSNGEAAILFQNNTQGAVRNVVVNHTISETEQNKVMGTYDATNNLYKSPKRIGVTASKYHYGAGDDIFFREFYIIGDMPMQFMTGDTSTTWNKFIFAENLLKQKADSEEYELINPTAFAFMEKALNATYQISGVNYNWSRIPNKTNTGVNFQIQIQKYIRQYIDVASMANDIGANATSLKTFNDCWDTSSGVPVWKTLND